MKLQVAIQHAISKKLKIVTIKSKRRDNAYLGSILPKRNKCHESITKIETIPGVQVFARYFDTNLQKIVQFAKQKEVTQ